MHSFVVYVDEAGDEGFAFSRGSSEWFVLSAVVTRRQSDLETVKLVDRVRSRLNKPPRANLHFRDMRHQQRDRRRVDDGDGSAKILFSNRSSMSYEELREYLRHLERLSSAQDIRIDWTVVRPDQVTPQPAHQMMGLQIADAVASSFFVALERSGYGFTEDRYVRMMKNIVYRHKGDYLGYGIKVFPSDAEKLVGDDQLHEWYPHFTKSRPPA